ncbi:PUB51 [Symbiodinium pilosum]|uniref:PUB51 protein n=1 Tax=Symbiodinium pilosum TaxID=2952 RepID=A0A812KU41_SYMPI|nr:PUB51 [Symbiodinium pilosum]
MESITLPPDCSCPITQDLMADPVVAADGKSYERRAIEQWLQSHSTSPLTNLPLENDALIPNTALKSVIQEFVSKLPEAQRREQEMRWQRQDEMPWSRGLPREQPASQPRAPWDIRLSDREMEEGGPALLLLTMSRRLVALHAALREASQA